MHIYLLTTRFRSLPSPVGKAFNQEFINQFFVDAEYRLAEHLKIAQSRNVKKSLKDLVEQYQGSVLAYDEGLVGSDAVLAAAIWRNIFGAGWGQGVAGVENYTPPPSNSRTPSATALGKETITAFDEVDTSPPAVEDTVSIDRNQLQDDLLYPVKLERLVRYLRKEVARLEALDDYDVMKGRTADAPVPLATQFGTIDAV